MKQNRQIQWAGLAVCAYAAWNAREIVSAWLHAPYDRLGWLAFLIWLAPLLRRAWQGVWETRAFIFGAALAVSLAGVIFDVNALKYAGFALACGGFFPYRPLVLILWLACAVGWMPVLGWVLNVMGPAAVNALRLVVVAVPFCADRYE